MTTTLFVRLTFIPVGVAVTAILPVADSLTLSRCIAIGEVVSQNFSICLHRNLIWNGSLVPMPSTTSFSLTIVCMGLVNNFRFPFWFRCLSWRCSSLHFASTSFMFSHIFAHNSTGQPERRQTTDIEYERMRLMNCLQYSIQRKLPDDGVGLPCEKQSNFLVTTKLELNSIEQKLIGCIYMDTQHLNIQLNWVDSILFLHLRTTTVRVCVCGLRHQWMQFWNNLILKHQVLYGKCRVNWIYYCFIRRFSLLMWPSSTSGFTSASVENLCLICRLSLECVRKKMERERTTEYDMMSESK